MHNKRQFYPTPSHIIGKMVSPLARRWGNLPHNTVLDPSAGHGDILDYVTKFCGIKKKNAYAIEIEENRQRVLVDKGYQLIDFDFMEYNGGYAFDLILMNPPFRQGVQHILRAWEILRPGGDLACLLNAETVKNASTGDRKVLAHLIKEHGRSESFGECFIDAEIPAKVQVTCVWLHKEKKATGINFGDDFWQKSAPVDKETFSANPLAHADILESLVMSYDMAVKTLIEQNKLEEQYRFYTSGVLDLKTDGLGESLNDQIATLKGKFWKYIFTKTRIGKVVTTEYQKKFTEFQDTTSTIAFNVRNIKTVLSKFMIEKEDIMQECTVEVFDQATKYHDKNKVHREGWKTNKSYKLNYKIIMPDSLSSTSWGPSHYRWDFLNDIDKVLCWLAGKDINDIDTVWDTMTKRGYEISGHYETRRDDYQWLVHDHDYTREFSSTFFDIRIYKKGTVHLKFKDTELLQKFNQVAAEGKNWVGPGF